ncbi:hypothetical protein ORK51_09420 [Stenotrophomonas rhizophila]|uniref:hypothetical protein n=1 Tax=Stenotrophomonas rhizophila TaxID=216778 RepID=UPI00224A6EDE|nr:hypothetical protein [Stenotrophomonas rhizophila]MCX2920387.1 hypothetical protein [Stenotrophomonas rhizophila]
MLTPDTVMQLRQARTWSVHRLWHWFAAAWQMYRHAPLRWFGLALVPMAVELVLQLSIPVAGVVLSKLVVPIASVWCLIVIDQRVRNGRFGLRQGVARMCQLRGRLLQVALLASGVFAFQMAVVWMWVGPSVALGMATADPAVVTQLTRLHLAAVFAAGTLPGVLLFFTIPRVVLDRVGVAEALRENVRLLGAAWRPIALYLGLSMLLVGSVVFQPWVLLPLLQLGYVGYWAYRDAFDSVAVA